MDGGSGAARAVAVAERRRRKAGGRGEVATAGRLRQCFSLGLFVLPWCFRILFFSIVFLNSYFLLCLFFFSFYLFLFFSFLLIVSSFYSLSSLSFFSLNSNIFFSFRPIFICLSYPQFISPFFLSSLSVGDLVHSFNLYLFLTFSFFILFFS